MVIAWLRQLSPAFRCRAADEVGVISIAGLAEEQAITRADYVEGIGQECEVWCRNTICRSAQCQEVRISLIALVEESGYLSEGVALAVG